MGVFFDIFAMWSHSSIGLERLATDEKVEGSNPSGTSKHKGYIMSLQKAVIVFFILVFIILLLLSLAL